MQGERIYTWEHSDPAGILAQSDVALARNAAPVGQGWPIVKGGDPKAWGPAVAQLRAWELRLLAACWSLSKEPAPEGISQVIFPNFSDVTYKSKYHKAIAAHLLTVPLLLAELKYDASGFPVVGPNDPVEMFRSQGSASESVILEDAGNPYLAALAIVVGSAAWTVGVTVVAQKASEVIDRQLAREEDTIRLTKTTGAVVKVVELHAEAELKAGKPLPFNDVERSAIGALRGAAEIVAKKQDAPLPSPLPSTQDIGSSFKIGAAGLAVAAIVAAYALTN